MGFFFVIMPKHVALKSYNILSYEFHFFVLFFIRAIFKLYIYIPTNCTQLIYFINNTLKHMYCLKLYKDFSYMFRSLSDHLQGDTILVFTSVTKL